jgi:HD superfamily phosphohydrolase
MEQINEYIILLMTSNIVSTLRITFERGQPQTNIAMLRLKDLDPLYQTVTEDEGILIANLGALCWQTCKKELFEHWSTEEEATKADGWKEEGRKTMLDSLKGKLSELEELRGKLLSAESRITQLNISIETKVTEKLEEKLETIRKDSELEKLKELSGLKEQIAGLEGKETVISMLSDSHTHMRDKIVLLETQLAQYVSANTKSSYEIGKSGEATVLELLLSSVIPRLPYAYVKDMTNVGHAGDFHLTIMLETGIKTKLLIDSKNYKRRVNTAEIEKLYADVDGDEEANGGILISLESQIFTMKQFQIARSPKQKPVLFLTFCEINDEMRKEIILWAIRILMDILSHKTGEEKEHMVIKIESFLTSLDESMTDLDASIRALNKSAEGLKVSRDNMLLKILNYRSGKPLEPVFESALLDGCIYTSNTNTKCGRKLIKGTTFCKTHVKKQLDAVNLG